AHWLREHCRHEQLVPVRLRLGEVPMHRGLDTEQLRELASLTLPLPSARMRLVANDPRAPLVHHVLAEEELTLPQLRIKGIRELFFSKGERAALCLPTNLTAHIEPAAKPDRNDLTLAFELPRGSYATLLVKRICAR